MTVNHYAIKITQSIIESTIHSVKFCVPCLLCGLLFFNICWVELRAEEGNIFSVSKVHVDETSSSSVDAKNKAISDGQFRAFQILLHRLVRFTELTRLPKLSSEEIEQYVRDFSVNNEKNSVVKSIMDDRIKVLAFE